MQLFEKLMLPTTILLVVFLGWVFIADSSSKQPITESSSAVNSFSPKSGEMGAVRVEVAPLTASTYEITLNTHSVDLDFDFKEIVTLVDNNGIKYQPVSWSGDRGGHHLNGKLQFSTIDPRAKSITLTIRDIEDEVLSLEWML